ncbi:hypothetical protein GDO81_028901 [Engystomops pustulosus]|uniref:Secreted protein n=1 Tax=Engystomops pustulosus TaxID=76066 RepID=A0AAV6YCR4_ENGPU|nr:hypothetical protein GDO81_028901 [Engystomops pustulosus]
MCHGPCVISRDLRLVSPVLVPFSSTISCRTFSLLTFWFVSLWRFGTRGKCNNYYNSSRRFYPAASAPGFTCNHMAARPIRSGT